MSLFQYKSLRCLAATALCTILFLLMLCSTTWAWYSDRIASCENRISAASFHFTITTDSAQIKTDYALELQKASAVSISLDPASSTAAGGYCMIQLKQADGSYLPIAYTSYFETTSSFSFRLQADADVTLRLIPCWGEPSEGVACGKQEESLLITNGTGVWSTNDTSHTA